VPFHYTSVIHKINKRIKREKKGCAGDMKQVMNTLKRTDAERRIPVLRLEIDYELATLFDALKSKDQKQINESKRKLERLRLELVRLEA
jgi:hypothetical protein